MARSQYAKYDSVLTAVVARLIDQLDDAGGANCYLSLDPDSLAPTAADFVYVVSPSPSFRFDESEFVGGEQAHCTVQTTIVVTIHSIAQNDEVGRDIEFLTNRSRGILERWRRVCNVLGGYDPTNEAGDNMLAQPLSPIDSSIAKHDRAHGSIQTSFRCLFDLDLTD